MIDGPTPFHQLHLDLIRNPHSYGITTSTFFKYYLFIVVTPGRLVGFIGLDSESSDDLFQALWGWLVQTGLLGCVNCVCFIRVDHASAFLSAEFTSKCSDRGIKVEGAAPKHQEMNGIYEAKWKQLHSVANMISNNARLGNAFFHHAHCYAVDIINVLPARNVIDKDGLPSTPHFVC